MRNGSNWVLLGMGMVAVVATCAGSASADATAARSRLATVWCRGTTMVGDRGTRPPASLPTTVPASRTSAFRAYYFNGTVVVGPQGWNCSGASGSNGATVIVSQGDEAPGIRGYVATPGIHSLYLACTTFRVAAQRLLRMGLTADCTLRIDPQTTIRRTATMVTIDTVHAGEGGRTVRRIQRIWWFPKRGAAAELTCFMVSSPRACDTAFRDFERRIRTAN